MKKQRRKKYFLFFGFFFIIIGIILSYFNSQNYKIKKLQLIMSEKNRKSVSFLFFRDNDKEIDFDFSLPLDQFNFKNIELYQNNKLVSNNIELVSVNNNKLTINLKKFIPKFNKIKLYWSSEQFLKLDVGQYYLEKINIDNNIAKENRFYFIKGHVCLKDNKFNGTYIVETSKYPSKIIIIKPKKTNYIKFKENINQKPCEIENSIEYNYTCCIPKEYFDKNKLKNINVEMLFVQKGEKEKMNLLQKSYIPFVIDNIKENQ